MTNKEFQEHYPRATAILGHDWLAQANSWPAPDSHQAEALDWYKHWFDRLEADLSVIETLVGHRDTSNAYRQILRVPSKLLDCCYEVHGTALLASVADKLRLHVARGDGSGKDFDVQANIQGHLINGECKVRDDDIIKPRFMTKTPNGLTVYSRTRATMDPHDMPDQQDRHAHDPTYEPTPESTVIRQRILDALEQLPKQGINIVVWGHKQGNRSDLERALYGAEVCLLDRDHVTKEVKSKWVRAGSGAFLADESGDQFRALNAILWIRLTSLGESLQKAYKLYVNPSATTQFPEKVRGTLEQQFRNWSDEA